MAILIRNATILSMDDAHGAVPFQADLLIEGDRINSVGSNLAAPPSAVVIDGANRLVMPGLVNAHVHSWEAMFKGRFDNLPLELWMLYSYPILGCTPLDARLIYLRSMLVGMDCLKAGVTCVVDDIIELPGQSMEALGAVFQAYKDLGIRANVSGHMINKPFTDTIPYANEVLPPELLRRVQSMTPPSTKDYLEFTREAISASTIQKAACDTLLPLRARSGVRMTSLLLPMIWRGSTELLITSTFLRPRPRRSLDGSFTARHSFATCTIWGRSASGRPLPTQSGLQTRTSS